VLVESCTGLHISCNFVEGITLIGDVGAHCRKASWCTLVHTDSEQVHTLCTPLHTDVMAARASPALSRVVTQWSDKSDNTHNTV
jgi:hypothetical protein